MSGIVCLYLTPKSGVKCFYIVVVTSWRINLCICESTYNKLQGIVAAPLAVLCRGSEGLSQVKTETHLEMTVRFSKPSWKWALLSASVCPPSSNSTSHHLHQTKIYNKVQVWGSLFGSVEKQMLSSSAKQCTIDTYATWCNVIILGAVSGQGPPICD